MPRKVAGPGIASRVSKYETAQQSTKGEGAVLPDEHRGQREINAAQVWVKKPA